MCGNPRYRSLSRYYGDHSSNRFTSTLKLLNMGEGVKTLRIGTDTSAAKELIEASPVIVFGGQYADLINSVGKTPVRLPNRGGR